MEKKRLFIVSFGNSREYRHEVIDPGDSATLLHKNPLEEVETRIKEYLSLKFPGQSLAYFESAKATEVDPNDERYADYPVLDEEGIEAIEKELVTEVEMRGAERMLDRDAPYSDVSNTVA